MHIAHVSIICPFSQYTSIFSKLKSSPKGRSSKGRKRGRSIGHHFDTFTEDYTSTVADSTYDSMDDSAEYSGNESTGGSLSYSEHSRIAYSRPDHRNIGYPSYIMER